MYSKLSLRIEPLAKLTFCVIPNELRNLELQLNQRFLPLVEMTKLCLGNFCKSLRVLQYASVDKINTVDVSFD